MKDVRAGALLFAVVLMAFALVGCGKNQGGEGSEESVNQSDVVVQAQILIPINNPRQAWTSARMSTGPAITLQKPIRVEVKATTSIAFDDSKFVIPAITPDFLDFGSLAITSLTDNNLRVCGSDHKQRCNRALFRMYTKDAPGPGLFNVEENYGIPLFALGLPPMPDDRKEVGFGAENALVVQFINIDPARRVLRLIDFPNPARFRLQADFSNAGAGLFATTLVLEYGLAP